MEIQTAVGLGFRFQNAASDSLILYLVVLLLKIEEFESITIQLDTNHFCAFARERGIDKIVRDCTGR
jgi:hypothetical protein